MSRGGWEVTGQPWVQPGAAATRVQKRCLAFIHIIGVCMAHALFLAPGSDDVEGGKVPGKKAQAGRAGLVNLGLNRLSGKPSVVRLLLFLGFLAQWSESKTQAGFGTGRPGLIIIPAISTA